MAQQSRVIRIREATWKRISRYGGFNDSFDDAVSKILDNIEGKKKRSVPSSGRAGTGSVQPTLEKEVGSK